MYGVIPEPMRRASMQNPIYRMLMSFFWQAIPSDFPLIPDESQEEVAPHLQSNTASPADELSRAEDYVLYLQD
jgi:hypothetical protein